MGQTLDPEVMRSFLNEVRTYLPALDQEWDRLRQRPGDPGPMEELHRLAHSLRSASEMIGLVSLAEAARGVESLLAPQEERLPVLGETEQLLLMEAMGRIHSSLEEPSEPETPELSQLTAALTDTDLREEIADELYPTFFHEAEDSLHKITTHLGELERGGAGADTALGEIRRHVHTLKGAAGMVGLDTTSRVAHRLEDLLDRMVNGLLPVAPETLGVVVGTTDLIADLVMARGDNHPLRGRLETQLEELNVLVNIELDASADHEPAAESDEIAAVEEADPVLFDTFLAEAEELLAAGGAALRTLEGEPADPRPALQDLRRSIHTLKGAAGLVGLNAVSALSRRLQFVLDRVLEDRVKYGRKTRALLFECGDAIADLIEARGQNTDLIESVTALMGRCDAILAGGVEDAVEPEAVAAATPPTEMPARKETAPAADTGQFVRVPLNRLDALLRLVGDLFLNASAFEQQLTGLTRDTGELSLNLARMRRISTILEETQMSGSGPAVGVPHAETASAAEFDTLEFDRYSQLHLLSRDLSEATGDLATLNGQLGQMRAGFDVWLGRQRGLSAEVQDKLMRLRMVPLGTLEQRLHRTVRVSAVKTGRQAHLKIDGLAIEFDKAVLEQLTAPLEHLLRNAVDHGIETTEARQAAGKPDVGSLHLEAFYQGAQVVVRLKDDGAGLRWDSIRFRAEELGWLTKEESEAATESQLARFLFEPGFSTSEAVSEVSGRGVGLDIVRATVDQLRGTVHVDSTAGKGTTFTLRLPLTLAVAKVLLIEAGGERYGLPLAAVLQTARIELSSIESRQGRRFIQLGPKELPLVGLADRLGLRSSVTARTTRIPIAIVETGDGEVAVALDRLLEAREVVVKPLSGWLRRVPQFGGATILGDGSVVLLLNPASLTASQEGWEAMAAPRRMPTRRNALEVLIVDDSVSIRRTVAALVRGAGWNATLAKDGMEALDLLSKAERKPNVILMDIEMPRMDGYELAHAVRNQAEFRGTPIVMLTSRAGEKHRRKARSLGVNEYLVKPYQDEVLLGVLRRCAEAGRAAAPVAS